jgi:hypothetical protein
MMIGCSTPMKSGGKGGSPGSGGMVGTGGSLLGGSTGAGTGGTGGISSAVGGASITGTAGTSSASLSVDRATLNIGTIDLGSTTVATLVVANPGGGPSGVIAVSTTAGMTATGCTSVLDAKGSCTLTISVTPAVAGAFGGTVTITANPGALTPLIISVVAIVAGGSFSVSPASIDLGEIQRGVPVPKQTITVFTSGAISGLTIGMTGEDVSIDRSATTCSATLAAGASCIVVVNFTAVTTGSKSDGIIISTGGKIVTVPITANAQNSGSLLVSPSTTQSFAVMMGQASPAITFTVENLGDIGLGDIAVKVTGSNASDFTASDSCSPLPMRGVCVFSVVFNPSLDSAAATRYANLVVTDTRDIAGTAAIPLIGNLYTPGGLTINPSTSDLGWTVVGSTGSVTVFTIVNTSDGDSGTLKATLSNPEFSITNDTCSGASIAKMKSCTLGIAFKPVTSGVKSAILTVKGSDNNPVVKMLLAAGTTSGGPRAEPSFIDFGSVSVNQTSPVKTVTLKNTSGVSSGTLLLSSKGSSAAFPISSTTCTGPLSPDTSCSFAVAFAPTEPGTMAATFTINDNIFTTQVAVIGTGTP